MAFQETTTIGYGTRVGRSFKAIGFGFLLFLIGTALLWWNEGRAVKTDKMLNEAEKVCVDMENPNKIDPAMDGELVCASALATTEDSLIDQQFGIGAKAISLQRSVEYYQWVEHSESQSEDKLGGKEVTTTTYFYSPQWVSQPVSSSQFHDPAYQNKNYVLANVEENEQWAENVTFGAYTLPERLFRSISSQEPMVLNMTQQQLEALDKSLTEVYMRMNSTTGVPKNISAQADSVKTVVPDSVPQENKRDLDFVHQMGNVLYYGRTPDAPAIGDVRVTFNKVVPAKVTIIAQVKGNTFKAFKAKNGKSFSVLYMGVKDQAEIFESEHETNTFFLWVFRFFGVVLVIFGLKNIFGFLETFLKVVPFLAGIFGWGMGVICTIVGIVWSLIVIAIAWLFYRPLLAIILLAIAGFLVWVFAFKGKDKLKELANRQKAQAQPQNV